MSLYRHLLPAILTLCALTAAAAPVDPAERADSAMVYFEAGNYRDAERCFKEALSAQPGSRENAMLLCNLGIVQTEMKKYPEALQSFDVALNIAPGSSYILSRRGATLLTMKRQQEALDDFSSALAIDSTLTLPRTLRAMTLLNRSDFKGAETDLRYLLHAKPDDDALLASLARCRELLGDRSEAEELLAKAITLNPDPSYYFDLTRMQLVDGDIEKARTTIADGIVKFPEQPELYVLRGYIHRKRYLPSEAEADRKIAVRLGVSRILLDAWLPEK